jgi:transposase
MRCFVGFPGKTDTLKLGQSVPGKEVHSAGTNTALPTGVKREAVELYRSSEKSIPKMAEELATASESLRRWIRQHETDEGQREGLITEEREELSRLRREVRVLKQERDFLKNAAASSLRRRVGFGECF